jgi:rhodanese-related sulfurtransferase
VTAQELVILMNRYNALVIDVRDAASYKKSHILGAVSFPDKSILDNLNRIKKHQKNHIVLVDSNGQTVAKLAKELAQKEYTQVGYLKNGLQGWQQANLPLQKDN